MKQHNPRERQTFANLRLPSLHVGHGVECGSITVFPVWTDGTAVPALDWTGKGLVIDEVDGGSVPQLRVTNTTDQPQLILEGDILEGGRQDRMAGETVLVMPGESIVIPVNCVEAGRWNSGRGHRSTGLKTSYSVREARRRAIKEHRGDGQSDVWNRIARIEDGLGEFSETSNFKERTTIRQEKARFIKEMESVEDFANAMMSADDETRQSPALLSPLDGQRGVIVGIGGEVVAVEVFATADAFAERWEGIAIAAGIDGQFAPVRKTTSHSARGFIRKIEGARLAVSPKGDFRFDGDGVTVTGVARELDEAVVLQFTATNDNAQALVG
jgi:hypothetical protein